MNLNEVKQKIAETLQGSFENLYFDKTHVGIDQRTPLEIKREFIVNFIRLRFKKIMTVLEDLPIDVSQYLLDIKINKTDFINLLSDLYSSNVYERTQIINGKKTSCNHRWFKLCIAGADCYHAPRFIQQPEPVSENTMVQVPPYLAPIEQQKRPTINIVNSPEPVISENTMVQVPKYFDQIKQRPKVTIVNSPEPVSENTMVQVPPYLAPIEREPEPEPELLKQKIKSKASLANILRDINELLLRFDNLAPAQQRTQNNYASVIKDNIVNLTVEDLYKLKYILDNGLSKDEFNHEFNENITTNIKPLGNRTERFIKILKTLPQREKRTVTEIFELNQKGGKTRKRLKVRTQVRAPTKFYY